METPRQKIDGLLQRFDQHDDVAALRDAVDLIDGLQPDPKASAGAPPFREEKLRLFLTVFNGIDAKRIPDFDFEKRPSMTSVPPSETGLPAGVDPGAIRDPKLRVLYEKEIAADQAKVKLYGLQVKLREVDGTCTEAMERHVSATYFRSSVGELDQLVDEAVKSPARQLAVKQQIAAILVQKG
jgi:hypothetical protein